MEARSNEELAHLFVERCRDQKIILPAPTTIERLCADALVDAERRFDQQVVGRLSADLKSRLDDLLDEKVSDHLSRFVWLRQFEVGSNSADANRLMDRLERLQALDMSSSVIDGLPAHRIQRWRRHGERYFADDLRDLSEERRYAIMAICATEWQAAIADTLVETHDRIVGKTWREAGQACEVRIQNEQATLRNTLTTFKNLGTALIEAHEDGGSLESAVATSAGWFNLRRLVIEANGLSNTLAVDPIAHVKSGYNRFRRYAPRMLRLLEIEGADVSKSLFKAIGDIRDDLPISEKARKFVRASSKWHRHLRNGDDKSLTEN